MPAADQPELFPSEPGPSLVHRYPKAERAIGYLIARAGTDDETIGDGSLHDDRP